MHVHWLFRVDVLVRERVLGQDAQDVASVHVRHVYMHVWHCYCSRSSYWPAVHMQYVDVLSYILPLVLLQLLQ